MSNEMTKASSEMEDKKELIKSLYCKGLDKNEMEHFFVVCNKLDLNPLAKQIYVYKMGGKMTIIVSIDGLRLVADRSKRYAPGKETVFNYIDSDKSKPFSATAYVKKQTADGTWHEVSATAMLQEYTTNQNLWKKMPHVMLAKCFSEDTEILTEFGFKKFSAVNGRIMQVTKDGIEAIDAKPFCQDYDGDMVAFESRDLDFCVTPNHDMITTSGKIEAGTMYKRSRARPSFFIPRIVSENKGEGIGFTQAQCELAAACLCDGDYMSSNKFRIKVSRPHKIEKILSWNLHEKETLRNLAGRTTVHSSGRTITTHNDQIEFSFAMENISPLVIPYKRLNHEIMMKMNSEEAKWFVDAYALFDGNANSGGGDERTLRIWSSDLQYISWLEILAIKAGYSVSQRKERFSDISSVPNYCISLSEKNEVSVSRWGENTSELSRKRASLKITQNESGKVWCVTVPSGAIVVRRNAFSMICGNCAEAQTLRKAFPAELSGVYTQEEMDQAEVLDAEAVVSEEKPKDPEISLDRSCELINKLIGIENDEDLRSYVSDVQARTKISLTEMTNKWLENKEKFITYFNSWREKQATNE